MGLRKTLVLLVILLVAAPAAHTAMQHVGAARETVEGTVKDALGRPLAGVEVELSAESGRSIARAVAEKTGSFFFSRVPFGICAIIARKKGYTAISVDVRQAARGVFAAKRNRFA